MISATQQAELLLNYIKQGDPKNPDVQALTMPSDVNISAERMRNWHLGLLRTLIVSRVCGLKFSFAGNLLTDLDDARVAIQKNFDDTLTAYRAQLKVVNAANNALTAATASKKATTESVAAAELAHQEARATLADTFTQFMSARAVEEYYRNYPAAVTTKTPEDILWAVFNCIRTDSYGYVEEPGATEDENPTSVQLSIEYFQYFTRAA
jgi:hypothetical protein